MGCFVLWATAPYMHQADNSPTRLPAPMCQLSFLKPRRPSNHSEHLGGPNTKKRPGWEPLRLDSALWGGSMEWVQGFLEWVSTSGSPILKPADMIHHRQKRQSWHVMLPYPFPDHPWDWKSALIYAWMGRFMGANVGYISHSPGPRGW